jgi:4-aminobutyrate aminotransferase/(S)-3-amino-2-methylpropionate transaminase
VEALMKPRLLELQRQDPRIGDVRGRGAMLAIELVTPGTTDPDPQLAARVAAGAHRRGVIALTCGTFGNVLRFLPPLTIGDDLLGEGLDVLAEALAETR